MAIVATGQMSLTDMNDAKQLVMYIGASLSRTVIYNGVSTYTPTYSIGTPQTLTPQLFVAGDNTDVAPSAITTKWWVQTNGAGALTELTTATAGVVSDSTNYTLTKVGANGLYSLGIKANVLASNNSMTYICELTYPDTSTGFNVTAKSEIEIVKVTNGTNGTNGSAGVNAITSFLTNSSVVLPANSAGTVSSFANSGTDIFVYDGTTPLTYVASAPANGQFTVVATPTSVTVGAISAGTGKAVVANATALSADIGSISYAITGKSLTGIALSATLIQSFAKSKAGVDGTTPTSYWMTVSADVIQKNVAGTTLPATLTITGFSQVGTGTPSSTASFKFVTDTSTDGTTFTNNVASPTGAVASTTFATNFANLKAVRFRMYRSVDTPSTSNYIDEQTVMVVSDGATGANAVYAYVWNPDGNSIKNSTGTINCHVDVYSGSTAVTGSAFKWYIQDPTATTVSGGDADGGNGWRLLNAGYNAGTTNYTTDTLTVPASAIAGTESFKCVVTYNSVKYSGVTTVVDLSDPIIVRIDGANIFKNGEGTVTVRATVLQSGAEIDAGGTIYTYTWSIYNSSNVKSAFAKTGKSITVSGTDIDGIGNLVCEISK